MKKVITLILCVVFTVFLFSCEFSSQKVLLQNASSEFAIDFGDIQEKKVSSILIYREQFYEKKVKETENVNNICKLLNNTIAANYSCSYYDVHYTYRCYEVDCDGDVLSFILNPKNNDLIYYLYSRNTESIKEDYENRTLPLLSEEECYAIAMRFIEELHNDEYENFIGSLKRERNRRTISENYAIYEFVFSNIVDNVIVESVDISVQNNGEVILIRNDDRAVYELYKSKQNIDFNSKIEEVDKSLDEALKQQKIKYTIEKEEATLYYGANKKLYVKVEYEILNEEGLGAVVYAYVRIS